MNDQMDIDDGNTMESEVLAQERHQLARVLVPLMKGVVYKETEPARWESLLALKSRVLDYVSSLGLTLILHEAEGYAFLRSRPEDDEQDDMPRLVTRRPLSFPVSLLLVLLRKRLVEFDVAGGDTRLVLTQDEIVDMVRLFMPATSNEAKLIDQVDTHINKIITLGFMRKLKNSAGDKTARFEVKRIIRSFVDGQWLSDFDERLNAYRAHMLGEQLTDTSVDSTEDSSRNTPEDTPAATGESK